VLSNFRGATETHRDIGSGSKTATAFPALQAFVPDVNGRYPWEEGVDGNASAQFLKGDPLRRKTMKS
jgi:hypothetical protein